MPPPRTESADQTAGPSRGSFFGQGSPGEKTLKQPDGNRKRRKYNG